MKTAVIIANPSIHPYISLTTSQQYCFDAFLADPKNERGHGGYNEDSKDFVFQLLADELTEALDWDLLRRVSSVLVDPFIQQCLVNRSYALLWKVCVNGTEWCIN